MIGIDAACRLKSLIRLCSQGYTSLMGVETTGSRACESVHYTVRAVCERQSRGWPRLGGLWDGRTVPTGLCNGLHSVLERVNSNNTVQRLTFNSSIPAQRRQGPPRALDVRARAFGALSQCSV